MDQDKREELEAEWKEKERVYRSLEPILERTAKVYEHGITSLWVGNASASLAILSFMGSNWDNAALRLRLFVPLTIFLLGVITMAIGSLLTLFSAYRTIESMQDAKSVLDFLIKDIREPTETIGLTFSDARTWMALVAGVWFIGGCLAGFVLILCDGSPG